jgi:hypothetical protein
MDITNVSNDPMYKKKLAEAKSKVAKAKAAKKKAETSYKLPGGRTKYDTYGVKNGFKSAD